MKEIYQHIWDLALEYQDKRDDEGHASTTLDFAQILVKLENGDEEVVIPAIILHDIGWSQLSYQRRLSIFAGNTKKEEIRAIQIEHQEKGVELARGILQKVSYPAALTEEILEIVSGHDTREGFISRNEGLVRDADKLWRFSATGFKASVARRKLSPETVAKNLESEIDRKNYFYSESAKEIAREELEKRREKYR